MKKRSRRAQAARETVAICEAGFYIAPSKARVSIADELKRAKAGTVLYAPENLPVPQADRDHPTRFEVKNETTFHALARLTAAASDAHLACLNFASAKNPGGGFLKGSLAQEESLACSSGLYPCLLAAPAYYERNRANRSTIYLDLAIYSPHVPFFRDDDGDLLEKPVLSSVITAPAPNAGSIARNEPGNLHLLEPALRKRAEMVLAIASANKVDQLVLGAWGCGVFQNDPRMVAAVFAELLSGKFARKFNRVVFAVYDRTKQEDNLRPFAEAFPSS